MGTTLLDLPKDYTATLVAHAQTLFPVYQRIIDEDYPPASDWLEDFYQGGKARDNLAKRARFGELQDQHTEALQQELTRWGRGVEVGCLCSRLSGLWLTFRAGTSADRL